MSSSPSFPLPSSIGPRDKKNKKKDKKSHKKKRKTSSPGISPSGHTKSFKYDRSDNDIKPNTTSSTLNPNAPIILQHLVKEQPNYNTTGKLLQATTAPSNNTNINIIKPLASQYKEPSDTSFPLNDYRLYEYRTNSTQPEIYYISTQSHYAIGAEAKGNHLILTNSSCSPYHAVLQYRKKPSSDAQENTVKPYIIDLNSEHGTYINGKRISPLRYVELLETDCIQFGELHDNTPQYILMKAKP
jgi:pSer/pThr/pTyr-binding forkhead associated (FHA) protein